MSIEKFDPTQCDWHKNDIDDIKQTLYGNGGEGLKVRFAKVETKVKIVLSIELTILVGMATLIIKSFI